MPLPQGPFELELYSDNNGKEPFYEWLCSLKDYKTRTRIEKAVDRMETGYFGDHRELKKGLYERRLFFGPGYRIYFGIYRGQLILLLCGGDKDSQSKDIQRAYQCWKKFQEEKSEKIS